MHSCCCVNFQKGCIYCGPLWVPVVITSCLPCYCWCACHDQYNECKLGSEPIYWISEELVDPKWENVNSAFKANFERGLERGAQLVMWENGRTKLDLAGIQLPETTIRPYNGNSVSMLWSTGKVLESIVMCMLVDRGLLDYDAKVSDYWPDFAKNGKRDIRVKTVLRHEAGLYAFKRTLKTTDSLESISKVIEDSVQLTKSRAYHMYSRGIILNQICIRVDPKGRTIGQFLKEELLAKIGMVDDIAVGEIPRKLLSRVHPMTVHTSLYYMFQLGFPSLMRCNMPWTNVSEGEIWRLPKVPDILKELRRALVIHEHKYVDMIAEQSIALDLNTNFECTSAWMVGTARALTKCLALMSQGGVIDGVRLIRESTVELALSKPTISSDMFLMYNTTFTIGGFCILGMWDKIEDLPEVRTYGWDGYNGSFAWFDYPGGKAVGYNCTAGTAHPPPWDMRRREILRQLGYEKLLHPKGRDDYFLEGPESSSAHAHIL